MHSSITWFCVFAHFISYKIKFQFFPLCFCFSRCTRWMQTPKAHANGLLQDPGVFFIIHILLYSAFSILRSAHSKIIRSFYFFYFLSPPLEAFWILAQLQPHIHTLHQVGTVVIGSTEHIQNPHRHSY